MPPDEPADQPDSPAALLQWCRQECQALPDARVDHPFDAAVEAHRIGGRIFALIWPGPDRWCMNLKADPDILPGLIAGHEFLNPGYHMNKRHWLTVELTKAVDRALVADLIEDSYDLVVAKLPLRLRPITHQ